MTATVGSRLDSEGRTTEGLGRGRKTSAGEALAAAAAPGIGVE